MKTLFSKMAWILVLVGAFSFMVTGCGGSGGVPNDTNTTQQQDANKTDDSNKTIKSDCNQTVDQNETNPLAEIVLQSAAKKLKKISREIDGGSNPYYELRYGGLPEPIVKMIAENPSVTYWVVDHLPDSILNLVNIKTYKRYAVQIKQAMLAYKIVHLQEFNDVEKQIEKIFISKGYPTDKYGRINHELLMSYFRMFSGDYGFSKKGVDSGIWQLILERANEIIEDRLANQEKTPVVEISIIKTPPMNIIAGKRQKVTTIEIDTMDSSDGVTIRKVFLNSGWRSDDLENCALYDQDNRKVTDSHDWWYIRENGLKLDKSQEIDKVKRYDLYCDIDKDLAGRYISFYRGNFEAEFDGGSAMKDDVFGDSYVYVVEEEETSK